MTPKKHGINPDSLSFYLLQVVCYTDVIQCCQEFLRLLYEQFL